MPPNVVDVGQGIGIVLIIGGLVLVALEIVHPGMFVVIPGTVVLAAGLLYVFAAPVLLSTVYGPFIVAAVAIAAALLTVPYYQRIGRRHRPLSTTPDSLVGETGLVVVNVVPDSLRGKVRIHSEIWSARADREIPAGTRVRVQGGQGVAIWVQPLDAEVRGGVP